MAHHIDWDNINHYIVENDVRYQRRLRRKQLYITCSSWVPPVHPTSTLNNLQTVVSRADPDMEMFLEGFRESDRVLVCKDDDNVSDDVSLEILENGQHGNDDFGVECSRVVAKPEPIRVKCGSEGDFVDPDVKIFKEDLGVTCGTRENVVDPDFKMLLENLVVYGHSFALEVKSMDGSIRYIEYEKDELCKGNDMKERKRGKVVPRGDLDSVSTKKERNVMVRGERFSRNSNRCTVLKRSSVVKRGDDIEIIFIGKPNEIEEVTVSKNYRPSKIIKKNKRPSKMDGGCNTDYLRKSKKQYEKPQRRPCLTRTGHVMACGEGSSRNSNRFTVSKRSSVVKRGDDIEIIFIGKPNETEEVTASKNYRSSKIIKKNKRPSKMDGGCYIDYLRKSKKQYEKPQRSPCLTRTDHVSNQMDILEKGRRPVAVLSRETAKYRRTTPGNKQRGLVVQLGEDTENSRFFSSTGKIDVMCKEEKLDDTASVVLVKKSMQMIQGKDSAYDDNLPPLYKSDKMLGKYTKVKQENATSLNYDEEENEYPPDLEKLRERKKEHEKLERRPCLTRTDNVSNLMNIVGKPKRHLAVMSRQSAKYRRTIPRNEQRDLVVWQGEDIEDSKFSSGTGNMAVMVKEEKFDDSANVFLVEKSMQVIPGRDSVYDNNSRPQYKCDTNFGKYAELREENAKRLNYDKEDDEDSSDLEILETDNPQNLSKFELTKVFNDSDIEDSAVSMKPTSHYKTSSFREELLVILKKPYNLEEYRSLMQKAKYRHLNWAPEYSDGLKGKDISNTYGKSPLDYHPDVQRRLRRCRRFSKRLNILRGFIYWYGRTCQDGAFKPWLDKSCLAVTPSPR